jgi:hypothetical protein
MTPSGIEPANFRFVVQCLNQLRHRIRQELVFWSCKFEFCCVLRCTGIPEVEKSLPSVRQILCINDNSIAFAEGLATDVPSGLCHFSARYSVTTGDHVQNNIVLLIH